MKYSNYLHKIKTVSLFFLCAALVFAAAPQERKRPQGFDLARHIGRPDNGPIPAGARVKGDARRAPRPGSLAALPILPDPPYEPVPMTFRPGFTGLVAYANTNGVALINPATHAISPMLLNEYNYTIDPETDLPIGGQLGSEGGYRYDVAITSDGRTALIVNFGDSKVFFVDLSSGTPVVDGVATIDMFPEDIAIDPSDQWALVTDGGFTPKVAVLNIPTRSWVPAGYDGHGKPYSWSIVIDEGDPQNPGDNLYGYANAVAIAPDGRTVVTADYFGGYLQVLLFDPATGGLSYSQTPDRLWKQGTDQYSAYPYLYRPVNVVISPDGRTLFAVNAHRSTFIPNDPDPDAFFEGCNLPVFTIDAPGHVTRRDDVIFPYRIDGGQSLVFSLDGRQAYLHTIYKDDVPVPYDDDFLYHYSEIQILAVDGPGRVRHTGSMRSTTQRGTSQLFGVDNLAITPDGKFLYATNPTISGASPVIDVFNLRTRSLAKRIGCPTMYPDPLRDFPDAPDAPDPDVPDDWIWEVYPSGIFFPAARANRPPVALIAADRSELFLDVPETATFDGGGSYDPERAPLTYRWTLVSSPAGAAATLNANGSTAILAPDPDVPGAYQVGLVVNDGRYDSLQAVATVVAKFYPVLPHVGAALQRLENDFIFYREYVNRLTWSANPDNRSALAAVRIYRKPEGGADSGYALLASLPAAALQYDDRGLAAGQLFTYRIVAVNTRGVESDPVTVGN